MLAIAPVVGLRVSPAGQVPTVATVASPPLPKVAGWPFTVPPAMTLAMGTAAVPATAVPLGFAGRMLPLTVTVSVVVAQLAGVARSHSW